MKTRKVLPFLFLLVFTMSSCIFMLAMDNVRPSGEVVKESRSTGGFTEIKVSKGLHAIVTQRGSHEIEIEANENFMEYIIVEVVDNELHLRVEDKVNLIGGTKNIYVDAGTIEDISVSSGASLESNGTITSDDLEVKVSSGAMAEIIVECNNLDFKASSGASLRASGKVNEKVEVDASSGANIKAPNLNGDLLDGEVSSGANIKVGTYRIVKANASSGGHLAYKGQPEKTDINSSSGGSVKGE